MAEQTVKGLLASDSLAFMASLLTPQQNGKFGEIWDESDHQLV
jgi:hypothetical protein